MFKILIWIFRLIFNQCLEDGSEESCTLNTVNQLLFACENFLRERHCIASYSGSKKTQELKRFGHEN